jgi:hypothetical protein
MRFVDCLISVGIIAFTSFRSRDLMSCDNASH